MSPFSLSFIVSLFEFGFLIYVVVFLVLMFKIDCDVSLKFVEKCGKSIDELRGKIVWITGASSGIGEGIAKVLAKHGVKLVLSARRVDQLERVKKECLLDNLLLTENDIMVLRLDMLDIASHQKCVDAVIEYFGKLDILINNAGRSQRALWEEIELQVDKDLFELDVFSVVSLSRIVLKYFLQNGGGHLAVTSSLAGILPVPLSASYTGAKHAIQGYYNSLRGEKVDKNITVTILCPGPTYSNFLAESFTARTGEIFNGSCSSTDNRMTAERCGQLSAIALANKMDEAWMGNFPCMPLTYLYVNFPRVFKILFLFAGPKRFLKLRDTKESIKVE